MPSGQRRERKVGGRPAEELATALPSEVAAPQVLDGATLGRTAAPTAQAGVRALASAVGNAAFTRRLQRQAVASAADAAARSPGGPLAKLRDELDDTFVDEEGCLLWIGQLGEGERTLVGRDQTMMAQMADAFNVREMLRAVELLQLPVAWQLHWIDQAGDVDDVDQVALVRMLGAATTANFNQLVISPRHMKIARGCYKGDPLALPPVAADPAGARGWLENADFADWVLQRTGAINLLTWMAGHDPAASLAAVKKSGRWDKVLDGLRRDGPAAPREAMKAIFLAATDAGDRKRLYELRFGRRAEGAFDWAAEGEAEWTRQESFAGGGQTLAQVEAQVKAGGPQTAGQAAAADEKGPLARLRDELDDFNVDEGEALRLLGQLNDRELYLVGKDSTMREQMASAFNGGEMRRALEMLRFLTLKEALAFIYDSDEEGDVGNAVYQGLVERSTAQDVAEAIGWERTCNVLKKHSHVNPLALAPLVASDAMMAHVISAYPHFTTWVLDYRGDDPGGASAYVRYMAAHTPAATFAALNTAGKIDALLKGLGTGSAMLPADRAALRACFGAMTDVGLKKKLLMKRFNIDKLGRDEEHAPPAGQDFEAATLDQIWDLLERLPPQDVAENKWLEAITRRDNPSAPTPQGVTGDNRIAVGYDPGHMGDPEAGAFADPADKMFGTNMFDSNLIHEMGHASDAEFKWTRDGGPFDTEDDLGRWKDHGTDTGALVDLWMTDLNVAATVPLTAPEATNVKDALKRAMKAKSTNAEDGFRAAAAAGGGPAYGAAGDTWKPLWTKVSGHAIVQVAQMSQASNSPWTTPPPAVNGRIYHDTDYNYWASYRAATRTAGKLSRYQFRDKRDFFAETYASYYLTPADPGKLVRDWNAKVFVWFRDNVDRGRSTQAGP